jgi:hypothetical protein
MKYKLNNCEISIQHLVIIDLKNQNVQEKIFKPIINFNEYAQSKEKTGNFIEVLLNEHE